MRFGLFDSTEIWILISLIKSKHLIKHNTKQLKKKRLYKIFGKAAPHKSKTLYKPKKSNVTVDIKNLSKLKLISPMNCSVIFMFESQYLALRKAFRTSCITTALTRIRFYSINSSSGVFQYCRCHNRQTAGRIKTTVFLRKFWHRPCLL